MFSLPPLDDRATLVLFISLVILVFAIVNLIFYLRRRHRTRRMLMERVAEQEALLLAKTHPRESLVTHTWHVLCRLAEATRRWDLFGRLGPAA